MNRNEKRERRMAIAETVKSGKTIRDAAQQHGVSKQLAYASCREFGVIPAKRLMPKPPTTEALLFLLAIALVGAVGFGIGQVFFVLFH